jgi:hypothetical protein
LVIFIAVAFCHLVSFLRILLLLPAYEKLVVEVGRQRNNRKMKGLNLESQPERMMVSSQDRVNGLNDAVWRH